MEKTIIINNKEINRKHELSKLRTIFVLLSVVNDSDNYG